MLFMSTSAPAQTAVATTAKRRVGRPKAQINLSEVFELASQGYSMSDIGRRLHVSERLLWQRCQDSPEFKEAYDEGLDNLFDVATKTLRQLVLEKHCGALLFLLRNKFKWTAGAQSEITIRHEPAAGPTIDMTNINFLAAECSRLLDHDPDAVDAEFVEVGEFNLEEAML
jgi:hypothetical protein